MNVEGVRDAETYNAYVTSLAQQIKRNRSAMRFNSYEDVYDEFGYYEGLLHEVKPDVILEISETEPTEWAQSESERVTDDLKLLARDILAQDVYNSLRS